MPITEPLSCSFIMRAGKWQGKQAVVVKLVAGSGGSGWCRPDAPMLRDACRAARLAWDHPNLAQVLAVRALVIDQAVLDELRQLLQPALPSAGAGLGLAAWVQAGARREAEAGLVLGAGAASSSAAACASSGVLTLGSELPGGEAAWAQAAAAAAAAGTRLRPMGRLQRFLMYSPVGPPLSPMTGELLPLLLGGCGATWRGWWCRGASAALPLVCARAGRRCSGITRS